MPLYREKSELWHGDWGMCSKLVQHKHQKANNKCGLTADMASSLYLRNKQVTRQAFHIWRVDNE